MEPTALEIYWEKQTAGRFCGVHSINSLLQGPFYNNHDLEQIALELDMKEKHLLQGEQIPSSNIDPDGNYSVQVLICNTLQDLEALKKVGEGLNIQPIFNLQGDFSKVAAFLCHSEAHWFGVRNIKGKWYNLNSTLAKMPQLIPQAQMKKFLQRNNKPISSCRVWAILGSSLPLPSKSYFSHYMPHQKWINSIDIQHDYEEATSKPDGPPYGLYMYGITEAQLMAMLAGYEGYDPAMPQACAGYDQLIAQAMKGKASGYNPATPPAEPEAAVPKETVVNIAYQNYQLLKSDADPDYFLMVRESIQECFKKQVDQGVVVKFELKKQQKTVNRKFPKSQRVQKLYDYAFLRVTQNYPEGLYKYHLRYKNKPLSNLKLTLQQLNAAAGEQLAVSIQTT